MSLKVVHTAFLPGVDHGEKLLEPLDATLVKGAWRTEDEIINHARDADAVIGIVAVQPFNRRVLGALVNCRIIASISVGFEAVDLEAASEYGIVATNVPDYCIDDRFPLSGCNGSYQSRFRHLLFNKSLQGARVIKLFQNFQSINSTGWSLPLVSLIQESNILVGLTVSKVPPEPIV